jgi:hypothetical protein
MASIIKVRDQLIFDLTIPENLPEIGVDGVSQGYMGFPISKVVFHVVTPPVPSQDGSNPTVEQRKAVVSLSINTLALLQFCQATLANLAGNAEQIATASDQASACGDDSCR